ncbi:DUF945 family protein [Salinicola aestuarinus]|uniref:DUF945 family protein n=1 Tax=Salinicola aestuarinus TaxID=1949082 RepID=UPI000DA11593|nr:DUF945 family protein [Salinicola aestuarinus]
MRRRVVAAVVVAVALGASYLGAQAYSSHRFEQETAALVAQFDASDGWRVERQDVERGWFHSRGRLVAHRMGRGTPTGLVVTTDYAADHGILRTSLEGRSEVRDDGEPLFDDWLDTQAPLVWQGHFTTLTQRVEMTLDVPAFHHAFPAGTMAALAAKTDVPSAGVDIDFGGLTLTLGQEDGTLDYAGELAPVTVDDGRSALALDRVRLDGRFTGDARDFSLRAALDIPRATLNRSGVAPVEVDGLALAAEASLHDHLSATATLTLDDTEMRGQSLLSGQAQFTLEPIDGNAYRRLVSRWQQRRDALAQAVARGASDEALKELLSRPDEATRDAAVALLADSPQLTVNKLSLTSELLGIQTQGEGALSLDGEGLAQQYASQGEAVFGPDLGRRLRGRLTLVEAPAFLKLYLGVGLDADPLTLTLADGVLTFDDQRRVLIP